MAPVRGLSSIKEVRESLDRQFHNDVNRLTYSKVSFLPIHNSTSSKMSKRLYASLLTFGWLKSAVVCILCALFSPSLRKPNVRLMWSIGSKRFFILKTPVPCQLLIFQGFVQRRARASRAQVRVTLTDEQTRLSFGPTRYWPNEWRLWIATIKMADGYGRK